MPILSCLEDRIALEPLRTKLCKHFTKGYCKFEAWIIPIVSCVFFLCELLLLNFELVALQVAISLSFLTIAFTYAHHWSSDVSENGIYHVFFCFRDNDGKSWFTRWNRVYHGKKKKIHFTSDKNMFFYFVFFRETLNRKPWFEPFFIWGFPVKNCPNNFCWTIWTCKW